MAMLDIPAFDGGTFSGYLAEPASSSAPAIIVCQEIFGVNAAMRRICDDLAQQGYLALCPDLFWRQTPNLQLDPRDEGQLQQAYALYQAFDTEAALVDLLASLRLLRGMAGCNGAVGTVGFCLGGKLAYLFMTRSDLEAGVSYYGVGLENVLDDIADVRRPLLLHVAAQDHLVPAAAQQQILQATKRNPLITAQVYPDVGHAFARPDGEQYDAAAAMLANQRSIEFLAQSLRR
jgi:carboxymethylenebutenolidase